MSIRKVSFMEGEYYHLFNRGNSKQVIFHDKQDHERFIGLLYACNSENNFRILDLQQKQTVYDFERGENLVSIGSYCLMPNHFHLLVKQNIEGGISKFMQKLATGYSMYYNNKYIRTGGLFEGKFKSEHADTDRYLKYLFSYINLNPVKLIDKDWKTGGLKDARKTKQFLMDYPYSSYLDLTRNKRDQNKILNLKEFPEYFFNKIEFLSEIYSWL